MTRAPLPEPVYALAHEGRDVPDGRHVPVTHVPIDLRTGEWVARAARLRWEVEQSFKLGESGSGLHAVPSPNRDAVRTLIYTDWRSTVPAATPPVAETALQDRLIEGRAAGPPEHRPGLASPPPTTSISTDSSRRPVSFTSPVS